MTHLNVRAEAVGNLGLIFGSDHTLRVSRADRCVAAGRNLGRVFRVDDALVDALDERNLLRRRRRRHTEARALLGFVLGVNQAFQHRLGELRSNNVLLCYGTDGAYARHHGRTTGIMRHEAGGGDKKAEH